jgi:putative transposase
LGQGRGRRISISNRTHSVLLIEQSQKAGSTLAKACQMIGVSVRTFERWRKNPFGDRRRGPLTVPANKLSEIEREKIIATVNSAEFRDKSPAQIVPLLADEGVYLASESSIHRILKQEGQNAHRTRSKPASITRPDEIIATAPNQVWSWDITFLKSEIVGIFFYLYLVMDIYSRKIVGFEVHEKQSSERAAEMITKICKTEGICQNQLILHSDNGKPMKGATMLATLQRLSVVPSFSRPSVSDDNPFSESLFKTLKYCPKFPTKPFASISAASKWVSDFVHWYNEEHLHSGINFVTPSSRHNGEDLNLLIKRKEVYAKAKLKNPARWSGSVRNWDQNKNVYLNCLNRKERSCNRLAA